jgi:hypothetical protein
MAKSFWILKWDDNDGCIYVSNVEVFSSDNTSVDQMKRAKWDSTSIIDKFQCYGAD